MSLFTRLAFFYGLFWANLSCAQVFQNTTANVGIVIDGNQWSIGHRGLSFYDVDHNGWDDLTFATVDDSIVVYLNFQNTFTYQAIASNQGEMKAVLWADYDNDGDEDLLVTRYLKPIALFQNDGNFQFTNVSESVGIVQSNFEMGMCAAWGDFDLDGYLDFYVCNYNWNTTVTNRLYRNLGNGHFEAVQIQTNSDNGSLPSFQPVWMDAEGDGDQDLYVTNDRYPIDVFFENTRISEGSSFEIGGPVDLDSLFVPLGDGWPWEEYSNAMGCAIADYDRDGDIDFYITDSNDIGNHCYQNNGSFDFTDTALENGTQLNTFCWAPVWIDYDNNGWEDIYVCDTYSSITSNKNKLLINDGGMFTADTSYIASSENWFSYSAAKGDLNNDGFYDIVFTNSNNQNAQFYENLGGENKWIKVTLEGTVSNRNGIGSTIEMWSSNGYNRHYTTSGEGFFSQDSQHIIMPLGNAEFADSIKITWLSGWSDVYYLIPAPSALNAIEGETFSVQILNSDHVICSGESIILESGFDLPVLWNTGITSTTLEVDTAGSYWFVAENSLGFMDTSDIFQVQVETFVDLVIDVAQPICFGQSNGFIAVENGSENYESCTWSTGDESFQIDSLAVGSYSYFLYSFEGCLYTGTIILDQPDSITLNLQEISPSCFGESNGAISVSNIVGGSAPYSIYWESNSASGYIEATNGSAFISALEANDYVLTITDNAGCVQVFESEIAEPTELIATMNLIYEGDSASCVLTISGGTPPYSIAWSNGDTLQTTWLEPGNFTATIEDFNGCNFALDIIVLTSILEEELGTHIAIVLSDRVVLVGFKSNEYFAVYDVTGKKINEGIATTSEIERPPSSGIYFITYSISNVSSGYCRFIIP